MSTTSLVILRRYFIIDYDDFGVGGSLKNKASVFNTKPMVFDASLLKEEGFIKELNCKLLNDPADLIRIRLVNPKIKLSKN